MSSSGRYPTFAPGSPPFETLDGYVDAVIGVHTHRRRSEHDGLPVDSNGVKLVVSGMARRLQAIFGDDQTVAVAAEFFTGDVVAIYVQEALRVHPSTRSLLGLA